MFLLLCVLSLGLYFGFAGVSHCLHSLRGKAIPDPEKNARTSDGDAMKLSIVSILGNALLTSPILVLIFQGSTQVYFQVTDYGWAYLLLSIVALLLFTETVVYWLHRALHLRAPYRLLHGYHHSFRTPTPWVSFAFHPLDSYIQALPYHIFVFLFPIHIGVYLVALVFVTLWTFFIHEPAPFFSDRWMNSTSHHEIHHACNKYNYGQFFTFWDKLGKTYRSPQTSIRAHETTGNP